MSKRVSRFLVFWALALAPAVAACEDDDGGDTVQTKDPGTQPGTPAPADSSEVVAGGGRVRGGNVTMDIQIGHGASQRQTRTGDGTNVEGNSAVKN